MTDDELNDIEKAFAHLVKTGEPNPFGINIGEETIPNLIAEIRKLQAEVVKLRLGLEFYARAKEYKDLPFTGEIARRTLGWEDT